MYRRLIAALLITAVLLLQGCAGRFVSSRSQAKSITLASYTSNSWFGWGEAFPKTEHLLLDILSASVYASVEKGESFEKISTDYKSGRLAPGLYASLFAVQFLQDSFADTGNFFSIVKLGDNPVVTVTPTPVSISAEYLKLVIPSLPEKYTSTASEMLKYITSADPQSRSKPDGMPAVILDGSKGAGVPELINSSGIRDRGFLVINASYSKNGRTAGGSGFGRVNCTIRAVIFDSAGAAVWRSKTKGTGSSFNSVTYFPLIWREIEISAEEATREALKELVQQIREDFY